MDDRGGSEESWLGLGQYWPRDTFRKFHTRTQRWAVMVCHRRAGKTVACVIDLVCAALFAKKQDARFAYVAPLYVQAKDAAWLYLKRAVADIKGVVLNETELRADFPNGARVRLYGADNADRLRGIYLVGVILDEYADMRPSVWGQVIRPMLADRQGWAAFIGTPKGRNEFHKLWEGAQKDPERWYSLMARASETGILDQVEIDDLTKDLTPEEIAQEFECSFDAAIVGAYFGKDIAQAERDGRITDVPYDPSLPVHTSWDLGVGDSTAIWFFQAVIGEIRIIDHYENHSQPTAHYVAEIESRGYRKGIDWVPHDAKIRSHETLRTRIETLASLGRKPRLVPNQTVEDSINAARITLKRCWFDKTKCAYGLEALRQYRTEFDEKTRAFKDHPRHDWACHTADAFRYLATAWREMVPKPPPKPPEPMRGVENITVDELIRLVRPNTKAPRV